MTEPSLGAAASSGSSDVDFQQAAAEMSGLLRQAHESSLRLRAQAESEVKNAIEACDAELAERRRTHAEMLESQRTTAEEQIASARAEADQYIVEQRSRADTYARETREQADAYAERRQSQADTEAKAMLAEAEIEFVGRGVVTDNSHQGWISRTLAWWWPF